ncbi:unnamed protein product [Leptidea sinapis]|uniref:Hexosyltransferase n=1 Tax=Leptidea sinapis TaxID=189913 RepID=A0A5E4PWK6_9NEOP|nr:unnamed protein product [Leptidea sinapis]
MLQAVQMVVEESTAWAKRRWGASGAKLVEGAWCWQPPYALRYSLLLQLEQEEGSQVSRCVRQLEAVRPLGAARLAPARYVTESTRLTVVLPLGGHDPHEVRMNTIRGEQWYSPVGFARYVAPGGAGGAGAGAHHDTGRFLHTQNDILAVYRDDYIAGESALTDRSALRDRSVAKMISASWARYTIVTVLDPRRAYISGIVRQHSGQSS